MLALDSVNMDIDLLKASLWLIHCSLLLCLDAELVVPPVRRSKT
jgi:hypothetical protein